MQEFASLKEVEAKFRCSRESIRRWTRDGKFPQPLRIGRRVLFRVSDLDRFVNERAEQAGA